MSSLSNAKKLQGKGKDLNNSEKIREACFSLLRMVLGQLRWRYAVFCVVLALFALVALAPAQLMRFFTENAAQLSKIPASQFLFQIALFSFLIAACLFLSTLGSTLCREWLRLDVERTLRSSVLKRIHSLSLGKLDSAQRGDWLTRMTTDLTQVEFFISDSLPQQLHHTVVLVGAATLFLFYSGEIAIIPIVAAILLAVLNFKVQRKLAPLLKELRSLHGSILQRLIESLEGIRTIRSQSAERFVQDRFWEKLSKVTRKGMGAVRVLGSLLGANQFLIHLMIGVCLASAAWALHLGQLTTHEVLIYPFFIGVFYNSAQSLAASAFHWNRFFADGGRLALLLHDENDNRKASFELLHLGNHVDFSQVKHFAVQELSYSYDRRQLVEPFDFCLSRGQIVAIVGASGCGKSTFLEVIAGLRETTHGRGEILEASGRCLWRTGGGSHPFFKFPSGLCAYVEQRPYIFEGTIAENLSFHAEELEDGEVWEVLSELGLHELVCARGGLYSKLNDRGSNLSEGQKYRLALARALLLRRPFLLLDEPFASLDPKSVSQLLSKLEDEKHLRGVAVVTHHIPNEFNPDATYAFEETQKDNQANVYKVSSVGAACSTVTIWSNEAVSTRSKTQPSRREK